MWKNNLIRRFPPVSLFCYSVSESPRRKKLYLESISVFFSFFKIRMSSAIDLNPYGYQTVGVIGQKRFGSVVQIREESIPKRMLVCKIIMLDYMSESDRRLAEQEVKILWSLNHPYIVKLENFVHGYTGSSVSLIMEYCDGKICDMQSNSSPCTAHISRNA